MFNLHMSHSEVKEYVLHMSHSEVKEYVSQGLCHLSLCLPTKSGFPLNNMVVSGRKHL